MAYEPQELFIQLPNLRIATKVWGPEAGMPTLAFHGWLDNASSFDELAQKLANVRLIAVDLPGHGLSQHRHDGVYHFIDYVADAIEIADALQLQRFCVLGHSLGTGVAALVAGTIPERVCGVVLLEGIGPLTNEDQEAPRVLCRALDDAKQSAQQPSRRYADVAAAVAVRAKVNELPTSHVQSLVERGLEQVEGGWQWRSDPRLRLTSRLRLTEAQVYAFLANIACPLLCVIAKNGFVSRNVQAFQKRIACIKDSSVIELVGGHHLHIEHAEAVAHEINLFLANRKISITTK